MTLEDEMMQESSDLYVGAKGFKEAAKMIVTHPSHTGMNGVSFLPFHTLLGFSTELYLKSWLRFRGYHLLHLKKIFGHDLSKLLDQCLAEGFQTPIGLGGLVLAIAPSHSDYTYRYFDSAKQYVAVGALGAFQALDGLDMIVDTALGLSASYGLAPGH